MKKDAIWLILLGSILLLLIQNMHGQSKGYERSVQAHLHAATQRLYLFDKETADGDSWWNGGSESLYLLRAGIDLELCRTALHDYKAGHVDKAEMDRLLKQLDRDMEDYPPQEAKR